MKRLILVAFSMLMFVVASQAQNSEGVNWEKGTLKEALNKAKEEGKNLVFLDCYTDWCGPCRYMSTKVFTTKIAGDYFNANFVNIKINMEKGEGVDVAKEYKIRAYPTFLILDVNGKVLYKQEGGDEAEAFVNTIKTQVEKLGK